MPGGCSVNAALLRIRKMQLQLEIPTELQDAIKAIPWKDVKHASYRKCKSVHFGLGTFRNCYRGAFFGRGSKTMPELQALLTNFIRRAASEINFASIIVNRYAPGESMDEHVDKNWTRQPVQIVGRFGDSKGAELKVGDRLLHTGVFLVDGNVPHSVLECREGVLYSFVSYIKQKAMPVIGPALPQLRSWGFQLEEVERAKCLL